MALGRSGRPLKRLLGGLWRSLKGLGDILGDMLAPKMAAKSTNYRRMCGSRRQAVLQRFLDGFCVEDKQPRRHNFFKIFKKNNGF